ncbi:hypothetical protein V5N11_002250 [Cardamine amara subsp. amara]|uniref:Uncharacterized protein n=1 Tax=Cardamine amara subsp. amara TaxID=228776 RepID=A0ABD0Z627_CARAN
MTSLSTSLLGIRRASSNKNKGEDKTKNAAFCKKHPKHRQSPDRHRFLLMAGGSGRGQKGISWITKSRSIAHKVDDDDERKKTSKGRFFFGLVEYKKR